MGFDYLGTPGKFPGFGIFPEPTRNDFRTRISGNASQIPGTFPIIREIFLDPGVSGFTRNPNSFSGSFPGYPEVFRVLFTRNLGYYPDYGFIFPGFRERFPDSGFSQIWVLH